MKKLSNQFSCLLLLSHLLLMFFAGCKSTEVMRQVDFCGIVIDEKNKPVKNFEVECYLLDGKKSNFWGKTETNESGLFIFSNLSFGTYEISGHKDGYSFLDRRQISFSQSGKVMCYQVQSLEAKITMAEEKYKNKRYEEGLEEIEKVYVEQGSWNQEVLMFYEAYGNKKLGRDRVAFSNLQEINSKKRGEFNNEEEILEEFLGVLKDETK